MRVLTTAFEVEAYGANRMACHYAQAMQAAGHDVTFAYERVPQTPSILPDLESAGVETVHVPRLTLAAFPGGCAKVNALARKANIVMCSQMRDLPAAAAIAARAGIPSLLSIQNMPHFKGIGPAHWLRRFLYVRAVRELATRVACCADGVRDYLVQEMAVPLAKTCVINNGLDISAFPDAEGDERSAVRAEFGIRDHEALCINIARIHRQKGQDVLIEALGILRARNVPLRVIIAGDNSDDRLFQSLKSRAKELDLESMVIWSGFRSDTARLLYGSDLFVLPSRWEGLPLAACEAMAAECPVLMSEYGKRFAEFDVGYHGWYVPKEDPLALADKMQEILFSSADQLRQVGRHGRQYVEEFLSLPASKQLFVDEAERLAGCGKAYECITDC